MDSMISTKFFFVQQIFPFIFLSMTTGSNLEWILLKYEIPWPESTTTTSYLGSIQFRICACPSPLEQSESHCKCQSVTLSGKPLPKARFPTSCLAQPKTINGKCAATKIEIDETDQFIYIRVLLGPTTLTHPAYQQVKIINNNGISGKDISVLTTRNRCQTISIVHSIQMPIPSQNHPASTPKPSTTPSFMLSTMLPKKLKKDYRKASISKDKPPKLQIPQFTAAAAAATAIVHSPSSSQHSFLPFSQDVALLCQKIVQMGLDAIQIRQFLVADAARIRIHPHKFDVDHYKRAIIQIHNRYRQMHGSTELVHDKECEQSAKSWADSVTAGTAKCLSHEMQRRFGESLFFYSSLEPLVTDADTLAEATVRTFYLEGRDYRRSGGPAHWDSIRHGHFTQMLWRSTRRIGVGVSIRQGSANVIDGQCWPSAGGHRPQEAWLIYVVLRYEPPGNIRWGQDESSFTGNVTMHIDDGDGDGGDKKGMEPPPMANCLAL